MPASNLPPTCKAVVVNADHTVSVQEINVPSIADNEILVEVVAAAQNPTDWKHVDFVAEAVGKVLGCDFAGKVVKTGKAVTSTLVGDRVAGFVHGGNSENNGAFAQYVKTAEDLAWKIPEGISFEQASTLCCTLWTAGHSFYSPTKLGITDLPKKVDGEPWILIYGGSTSVGLYAIQLAMLSGYRSVVLVSDKNAELCKSLGATETYAYQDPDAAAKKVQEITGGSLTLAIDTISLPDSQIVCLKSFGDKPGKLVVLLDPLPNAKELRKDVEISHTFLYTTLGEPFRKLGMDFPAFPDDRKQMAEFVRNIPTLLANGQLKPNPVKVWEGGLESVGEGLRFMQDGKVSAEKIVYRV